MPSCALCREERELRRSHIIPEFAYRPTYDTNHSAIVVDFDAQRRSVRRRGFWDSLLCDACEGRVGQWENYFANMWFGPRRLRPEKIVEGLFTVEGIEYSTTKLFFLSIFWRASVSKMRVFRPYSLGPHQERVRSHLIAGDPGGETDYPLAGIGLLDPDTGGLKDAIVRTPEVDKVDGHHYHSMIFGGVHWVCVASSHMSGRLVAAGLKEDGTLDLLAEDWKENPEIKSTGIQMARLFRGKE